MSENIEQSESQTIELKDPAMAGFLAWLVPGLGHFYQGRRAKALLYFLCIMGLFVFGLIISSSDENNVNRENNTKREGKIGYGRAVYFSWKKGERTWGYICQAGIGLPALPALVQAARMNNHDPVWFGGFMAPPRPDRLDGNDPNKNQPTLHDLHRVLNRRFELGWVFTTIAGLLNVLAIYDACAGPVPVVQNDKKKKDNEEEKAGEKS